MSGVVRRGLGLCAVLGACGCAEILGLPDDLRLEEPKCVAPPPRMVTDATEPTVRVVACPYDKCAPDKAATPSDLRATLCPPLDATCKNPLATNLRPNDAGVFEFPVPAGTVSGKGFSGYLKIESLPETCRTDLLDEALETCPQTSCEQDDPKGACALPPYVPSTLFFNPPIVASSSKPEVIALVPTGNSQDFVRSFGLPDASVEAGGMLVRAVDACTLEPVAGVVFELDPPHPDARYLYVAESGTPTTRLTATSASGIGGINNLPQPPGVYGTVTAHLASDPTYRGQADFLNAPLHNAYVTVLLSKSTAP